MNTEDESISGVWRIFVVYNLHILGAFSTFLMLNQPHPFESGANEMGSFVNLSGILKLQD